VSGSGKSSLVFGTIALESQRLINETYTGTPADLVAHGTTLTAYHLRAYVRGTNGPSE
jgi:hypothetical protein